MWDSAYRTFKLKTRAYLAKFDPHRGLLPVTNLPAGYSHANHQAAKHNLGK